MLPPLSFVPAHEALDKQFEGLEWSVRYYWLTVILCPLYGSCRRFCFGVCCDSEMGAAFVKERSLGGSVYGEKSALAALGFDSFDR